MSIRVLIVSDNYPPFIGGAHRQTQLLAKQLSERGYDVYVATVWHSGIPAQEEEDRVKVFRLKQLRTWPFWIAKGQQQRHQPPFPDPVTVLGLRKLISNFMPDIIHSYGWISYSCAAALLGKNIPLLISARDYGYSCATRTLVIRNQQACSGPSIVKCLGCASALYGLPKGWIAVTGIWMSRGLLKSKIRGIHSISHYVQYIMDRDFWGEKDSDRVPYREEVVAAVIPSFQENDDQESLEANQEIQNYLAQLPAQPFILFVGAFRRVKGVTQLLEAYQQLHSPPPLVMIGTVEADTPPHFPPGVIVLRNFPHSAVMAAWERSLFGVLPSLWPEPLGSVVYEGMSKGKAIIGTTPGGHTDMISDNETGVLIPAGDINALVASMQKLIDDPELCQRLGKSGLERSKMYGADMVVPAFETLYSNLLSKNDG